MMIAKPERALVIAIVALVLTSCAAAPAPVPPTATPGTHDHPAPTDQTEVELAAAAEATQSFAEVGAAESAGYASTAADLGCFHDAESGGMGVHWLRTDLLDADLDPLTPEALVYELGEDGEPVALVAHEYIVPVGAWDSAEPPELFGTQLHEHPVLPLWVLHAWVYRDNPSGTFADFNPDVAMCPDGVKVFGAEG